ncbi:GlxA family transcriptional regulator [Herbidospora cretacea]|uniref:GlxA family transcriptional regulator n=1 Tax=Herbidospora cretacea TaxID=28444 RepID=UPI0004C3BE49|nr:GlxA family transcriptional regulator [Herbidospora cretacea]
MRVVCVITEGFQHLDLAGPADVFATAGLVSRRAAYTLEVTSTSVGPVRASNGLATLVETPIDEVAGPIDTLLVAGGPTVDDHLRDPRLVAGVRRLAAGARRTGSVCTGAFLLAEAGLLDGGRATTHWLSAGELSRRYPAVETDSDAIYVRNGDVWTSAGVTTGIDLALAMVADDHGHRVARDVARGLVVYLHRPGGQSQFSAPIQAVPRSEPLKELQAWIDEHPEEDLSVPALARRMNLSERHFSRVFTDETGMPPGRYVEIARTGAARRLLETTDEPLDVVARRTGLGLPGSLYRVFRRHLRVSPGDYRRRFRDKEH